MQYDVIIIGGGPGGYIAAERAAEREKKVLLIEEKELGGVCLNAGCIPTKTLLHTAKAFHAAKDGEKIGVKAENVTYDLPTAIEYKTSVIQALRAGIAGKMKKAGVQIVSGRAMLVDAGSVACEGKTYTARNILIATGSSPAVPPVPGLDSGVALTSTELLERTERPERLAIVGGGYIGMEFASFFGEIGTEVTVVEMMSEIVPFLTPSVAAALRKSVRNVTFELGARVEALDGTTLRFSRDGKSHDLEVDRVLVAVGRKPNTAKLGLEELGVAVDRAGIVIDERMRTNVPGVFAIGDVTGRAMLAHAASRMGEIAVATMFDDEPPRALRYDTVPWVVFTLPEVAGCGLTVQEAEKRGIDVVSAQLTFKASGRYVAEHPNENGFCTVLADAHDKRILGVEMIGSGSSELIFGAAVLIENEIRVQDVSEIVFPHPTVSEVLRDTIMQLA